MPPDNTPPHAPTRRPDAPPPATPSALRDAATHATLVSRPSLRPPPPAVSHPTHALPAPQAVSVSFSAAPLPAPPPRLPNGLLGVLVLGLLTIFPFTWMLLHLFFSYFLPLPFLVLAFLVIFTANSLPLFFFFFFLLFLVLTPFPIIKNVFILLYMTLTSFTYC